MRQLPNSGGALAYAKSVRARLGGWIGEYGKPGYIVMLQGWLEIETAKRTHNNSSQIKA